MANNISQSPNKPKPLIRLQKDFPDFSHLSSMIYERIESIVSNSNLGRYKPARAPRIFRPMVPLSQLTQAEQRVIEQADMHHSLEEIKHENSSISGLIKKNIFDQVKTALDCGFLIAANRAVRLTISILKGSFDAVDPTTEERFRQLNLSLNEKCLFEFRCSCSTGLNFSDGFIYITPNFLIFHGTERSTYETIQFSIPLWKIKSFHRARSQQNSNGNITFTCVDLSCFADAVLFYTSDYFAHSFFGFSQTHFYQFLFVFDFVWRELANPNSIYHDVVSTPPNSNSTSNSVSNSLVSTPTSQTNEQQTPITPSVGSAAEFTNGDQRSQKSLRKTRREEEEEEEKKTQKKEKDSSDESEPIFPTFGRNRMRTRPLSRTNDQRFRSATRSTAIVLQQKEEPPKKQTRKTFESAEPTFDQGIPMWTLQSGLDSEFSVTLVRQTTTSPSQNSFCENFLRNPSVLLSSPQTNVILSINDAEMTELT